MGTTLLFGVVASSALVIGAAVGARVTLPKRLLASILAFAAGALITALTFELFEDSYERGGILLAAFGLFAGAIVFTVLSALLDRWAAPKRADRRLVPRVAAGTGTRVDATAVEGRGDAAARQDADDHGSTVLDTDAAASDARASAASVRGGAGLALLAAVTLDGVPENLALGITLEEGAGSLALLAAIFVSNLPESLVGAASMRAQGMHRRWILLLWTAAAVLLTLAVVLGAAFLAGSPPEVVSFPLAFAAGAVIASLANTLMPEAFEDGGPAVALSTAAGFVLSFVLSLA